MPKVPSEAEIPFAVAGLTLAGGLISAYRTKALYPLFFGLRYGAGFGATGYLIMNIDAFRGHTTGVFCSGAMAARSAVKLQGKMSLDIVLGTLSLVYHATKVKQWWQ